MRKSNWIFFLIACAASIILLMLWYALGFDKVDSPLDLVLSVAWWVIAIAAAVIVSRMESKRRYHQRTVYVMSDGSLFSPELGTVCYDDLGVVDSIAKVIGQLDYPLESKELDEDKLGDVKCLVYTDKFENGGNKWSGKVAFPNRKSDVREYVDMEELVDMLAA